MIQTLDIPFTAGELAAAAGGELLGDPGLPVPAISTDSRDKNPGGAFAAIRGERFDGADFASAAVSMGAALVISHRPCPDAATLLVRDTTEALGLIAAEYKRRIAPLTVAVTGSVGKTTTKQLLSSLLSQKYKTRATEGNFNNEVGLPLTLLSLERGDEAAVLELGMSARGEISRLSKLCQPDIAVITCIGSSHLEYLHTRENIRDAKLEIRDGMREGGRLILNGDEPLLSGIGGAAYVSAIRNPDAYACIEDWYVSRDGSFFTLSTRDGVRLPQLYVPAEGMHIVTDAALAVTAALLTGLSEEEIRAGLRAFENTGMRQRIYGGDIAGHNVTVIEDCYNAAPESMKAALELLRGHRTSAAGRTIAVLGDMRELGESSPGLHRAVGEYAADCGIDALFAFGCDAADIASGAMSAGRSISVYTFPDTDEPDILAAAIAAYARAGDTLLFKASRAVGMERVIGELLGKDR